MIDNIHPTNRVAFGADRASVVGGAGVKSFIRRNRRITPEAAAREFASTFPIERLRKAAPYRTGKLSRSLKVVQRGSRVWLLGVWYGRFHLPRLHQAFLEIAVEHLRHLRFIK